MSLKKSKPVYMVKKAALLRAAICVKQTRSQRSSHILPMSNLVSLFKMLAGW